jgi:hypothetical protein
MIHTSLSCVGALGAGAAWWLLHCMPDPRFEPTLVHCLTQCGPPTDPCSNAPRPWSIPRIPPVSSTRQHRQRGRNRPRERNLGSCCSWIYYVRHSTSGQSTAIYANTFMFESNLEHAESNVERYLELRGVFDDATAARHGCFKRRELCRGCWLA